MNRRGAALIIVLLILVALMLLGLPFLFSQSWGLSGARNVQAHQAAQIYLGTAERLGAALAVDANHSALAHTTGTDLDAQIHSAIELYIHDKLPTAVDPLSSRTRTIVDPRAFGLNQGMKASVAVSIVDEAGMLDPNLLDADGWADLFVKLEIPDWDDDDVDAHWQTGEGPDQDHVGELAQELVWWRINHGAYARLDDLRQATPQLSWRHTLNGNRVPHPEFRKRLNAAEVERLRPYLSFHNRGQGRGGLTDLGSLISSDKDLTVGYAGNPPIIDTATAPGKWFVPSRFSIDLGEDILNHGTWFEAEPKPGDPLQPGVMRITGNLADGYNRYIDYPGGTLPERDSGVWLQVPAALNVHELVPRLATLPAYTWSSIIPFTPPAPATQFPQDALFPILCYGPDPVNAPPLPWDYLRPRFWPYKEPDPAGDAAAQLAARKLIGPPRERQPLDLRSDGLVRITSAATILDAAGGQAAQRQRTAIVQAVPQEAPIEHRWITQGQFEPLVGQRFTSLMTTWPRATSRATDLQPADVKPGSGDPLPALTGLSFSTLPGPANATLGNGPLPYLDLRWRAPLGSGATGTHLQETADSYVLRDRRTVGAAVIDTSGVNPIKTDLVPPELDQVGGEGLFPDGVRIGSTKQLAYAFDRNGGPLRMANANAANPADPPTDAHLGYCHIGFWFRPENEPDWSATATAPITLMEARQHPLVAGSYAVTPDLAANESGAGAVIPRGDNAAGIIAQNYLGVFYDQRQNMLVATYTPPSATCVTPALPWTAAIDDNTTPDRDERCLPPLSATTPPLWLTPGRLDAVKCLGWSQTYLPNRIMTCWKLGNLTIDRDGDGKMDPNKPQVGQWYHLQLVIGNGRPGGIGILLDGIAGTDVGLVKASDYLASRKASPRKGPWPGDHLTIPSLLLLDDLPAVEKPVSNAAKVQQFYPAKIGIEMPGFAAFGSDDYTTTPTAGLTPADTLQSRGTVLIGDEYIRYESIGQTSGTWELRSCTRGFRQDSDSGNSNFRFNYPTTETHAKGSRVLADGARVEVNGQLLQGGTATTEEVRHGSAATDYLIQGVIRQPRSPAPIPFATPITSIDGPDWALAPDRGYIRLDDSDNHVYFYYYTKTGTTVELKKTSTDLVVSIPALTVGTTPFTGGDTYSSTDDKPAKITLVSLEVTDSGDLVDPTMWKAPTNGDVDSGRMLQLLDPGTGRCEWLRYTHIIRRNDNTGWFINRYGWGYVTSADLDAMPMTTPAEIAARNLRINIRQRGQQRTAFAGTAPGWQTTYFPDKTLVLPVQTGGNVDYRWAKAIAPGDLVTLFPKDLAPVIADGKGPLTACVRYSANDGYSYPSSGFNDTVNGWLAFTAPLKGLIRSGSAYEMVMGTGLNSPRDLTPLDNNRIVRFPASATPRLDAHARPGGAAGDPGRLLIGSEDTARRGIKPSQVQVSVDGMYAGAWENSAGRIVRAYAAGGALTQIGAFDDLPIFVEADQPVFKQPRGDANQLMLLEIGGEVFACELLRDADKTALSGMMNAMLPTRKSFPGNPATTAQLAWIDDNRGRFAKLVGRGLLGSGAPNRYNGTATGIPFAAGPDIDQLIQEQKNAFGNLDLGPEFFRLPVGPVRYLSEPQNLADGKRFAVDDVSIVGGITDIRPSGILPTSNLLISEPNRPQAKYPWEGRSEIMRVADSDDRKFLTAWDPVNRIIVDARMGGAAPDPNNPAIAATNPNYGKMITGAWLRGLYNTPADTDWTQNLAGGRGDLKPLVIGWWPRYASCLPSLRPTTSDALGDLTIQHLRSRLFPWIGTALRLHAARFDDTSEDAAFMLRLDAASNGCLLADQGMRLEVRAMAGSIDGKDDVAGAFGYLGGGAGRGDWRQVAVQLPGIVDGWQAVKGLYPWNPGGGPSTARETDGVEVRLHFRYTDPTTTDLSEIARNGGRAPLIGGLKLRCYAPITTVATEEVR